MVIHKRKKNGTVYNEHPAIETVNAMQEAWIAGDDAKVATFLADDLDLIMVRALIRIVKEETKRAF